MLDPHRLRMLRAVITQGSVHAAASRLGYTPSTVSQHLKALQSQTGLVLLERQGRGVVPTPAGLRLAEEAEEILARLAALTTLTRDLRADRDASVTMSYVASAGVALVPSVVAAVTAQFTDLRLHLRLNEVHDDPTFAPDLNITVTHPGVPATTPDGYHDEVLLQDPYLAVVPADHRWAERVALRPADMAGEPLVDNDMGQGPCRQAVLDLFGAVGAEPVFTVEAHDYAAAIEFVAAGLGITIIPRLALRRLPDQVRVIPITDPVPSRTLVLRTKASATTNPAVQRITELLHAAVLDLH